MNRKCCTEGRRWYTYTGADADEGILSNYQPVLNPAGCDEGRHICAICATGDSSHPDILTPNLIAYIARAKQTSTNQPDTPVDACIYVYTRTNT